MREGPFRARSLGAPVRIAVVALLITAAGALAAACGSSGSPSATSVRTTVSASCAKVSGAHHARVVVETSPGHVVRRCVGFAGKKVPALTLLRKSHIELGTQKYSFGLAICQVDHAPSHYSQCLASGQDYWALFLSANGHRWTVPSTGVSDVTVPAGGALGLRYDSPKGTPAPPPPPSRA